MTMTPEGHLILLAIHREAWIEYTVAHMQCILDARGEGLFEFYATDPKACLDALSSHVAFEEWVTELCPIPSVGPKRL